jgi:hypothetical protein
MDPYLPYSSGIYLSSSPVTMLHHVLDAELNIAKHMVSHTCTIYFLIGDSWCILFVFIPGYRSDHF